MELSRLLSLSVSLPGITTWAEPGKAVYLKEDSTGKTAQIGYFDRSLPGTENKMKPLEKGFRELGIPALFRCMEGESEWVCIDEIGYLDSCCEDYCEGLRRLLECRRILAVVRKQELPFLSELCARPDVFLMDLDEPYGRLGCVIMASGLGRRFGGNKLMADFEGRPLVQRVLNATEGIFTRRVVVTRHRDVEELCRSQEIPVIFHSFPHRSDTVRLGLEALLGKESAQRTLEGCLFCPGDQPLLCRETVASLALCAAREHTYIWRAAWEGHPGSPVLFPAWAFGELLTLPEGKGGNWVVQKYLEQVRFVSVQNKWELADVDCPGDMARLSER